MYRGFCLSYSIFVSDLIIKKIKMKKNLLSICAILVATATFAQQANLVELPNESLTKGYSTMSTSPSFTPSSASTAPQSIWDDDCSDINTWTVSNTSTLGYGWAIETDPNATPAGGALTPMASASASNGYMMISSDLLGGTADNDGTTISTEFTNATPIDLTMYQNVQLTFQHNFRWWNDTRIVRISPDNGVNWVELDVITDDAGYSYPAQSSDNPHMSTYDISSIAGGMSEVLVQFYYNDNDIWAWYWAIDDIAISELPDNNIVSSDEVMGGWWIGYQTVGGLGQDYTFNPMSQATANPYAFESVLRNGGIATQDVTMNVAVTEDATASTVFTSSSNVLTLAAAEQDTVAATATFVPMNGGSYSIEIWSEADSAGAGSVYTYSDTATKVTVITDYTYGKDYNSEDGYWRIGRTDGGLEISSTYDIYADVNLYSVDAHISDWSIPGAQVYAVLYEEDMTGGDPILLDQTDDYTIQSSDLGAWINLDFSSSFTLTTGTTFRIAIGSYIHPFDTVGVNTSGLGEYTAQGMFDKDGVYSDPLGTPDWYTISGIPMLRMNFNPSSVSVVSDVKQTIFNTYPNPTNGIFIIELGEVAKYDVTVNNVLGQTVLSTITNGINTTIDLSAFDKGIYTVELNDENEIYTEKLIVE